MISDEIITLAATELNLAMINSIPNESHHFSKKFERKMRLLIRKVNYPRTYSFLSTVAGICIALLLSFVITMMFSVSARAAVINWIKEHCGPYIEYIIPQTHPDELPYYTISPLLEEFTELSRINTDDTCVVTYSNSQGQEIHLMYSKNPNAGHLFVIGEESTLVEITIGGSPADLYIPNNSAKKSSLVWYDTTKRTLFYISAQASPEVLVYYAKNIN